MAGNGLVRRSWVNPGGWNPVFRVLMVLWSDCGLIVRALHCGITAPWGANSYVTADTCQRPGLKRSRESNAVATP